MEKRRPYVYRASKMMATEFPPPDWIVEEILGPGLALFVGGSKLGKSHMALHLALAVASGGVFLSRFKAPRDGEVVYVDLEQPQSRRKERLARMLAGEPVPELLAFSDWWPSIDAGAPGALDEYLTNAPTRLVIVDTVAKIWGISGKPGGGANAYYQEYSVMSRLKEVADKHKACVLLVHHRNKSKADSGDKMDVISGTNAMAGACDTVWILDRKRGEETAELFVTGRDVREQTLPLEWAPTVGGWAVSLEHDHPDHYREVFPRRL